MTLKEIVNEIINRMESEAKERKRREREREEIEKKRKEHYETHMKEETERLNTLVGWYLFKLNEIREAPIDDRPRMLWRLYRISKKNKHLGVTITRAGLINPVNYPKYPPELKIPVESTRRTDWFLKSIALIIQSNEGMISSIISRS